MSGILTEELNKLLIVHTLVLKNPTRQNKASANYSQTGHLVALLTFSWIPLRTRLSRSAGPLRAESFSGSPVEATAPKTISI